MSVYSRTHETGVPDAMKGDDSSIPAHLQQGEDDDWETDPDYVNDVSEKDQRWGSKEIIKPDVQSHEGGMDGVRAVRGITFPFPPFYAVQNLTFLFYF
jgi:hypothetical protein